MLPAVAGMAALAVQSHRGLSWDLEPTSSLLSSHCASHLVEWGLRKGLKPRGGGSPTWSQGSIAPQARRRQGVSLYSRLGKWLVGFCWR